MKSDPIVVCPYHTYIYILVPTGKRSADCQRTIIVAFVFICLVTLCRMFLIVYCVSFAVWVFRQLYTGADQSVHHTDCLAEWLRLAGASSSQVQTLQESGGLALSSLDEKVVKRTSKHLLTLYLGFNASLATSLKSCIGKIIILPPTNYSVRLSSNQNRSMQTSCRDL